MFNFFLQNRIAGLSLYPIRKNNPQMEMVDESDYASRFLKELYNTISFQAQRHRAQIYSYTPEGSEEDIKYTLPNALPPDITYFKIDCNITRIGSRAYDVVHPIFLNFLRLNYRDEFVSLKRKRGIGITELVNCSAEDIMAYLHIDKLNLLSPLSTGKTNVFRKFKKFIDNQDIPDKDYSINKQAVFCSIQIQLTYKVWNLIAGHRVELFSDSDTHYVNLAENLSGLLDNIAMDFLKRIANYGTPTNPRARISRLTRDANLHYLRQRPLVPEKAEVVELSKGKKRRTQIINICIPRPNVYWTFDDFLNNILSA